MSVSPAVLDHHVRYSCWASRRLLEAVSKLTPEQLAHDFGTADKTVTGTLAHIYRSERTWLARLEQGTPPFPWSEPGDDRFEALQAKWPAVQEAWLRWAGALKGEDPERLISYSDLKGNPWRQPLWPIVFHVVNHSTHHRGQVAGFLRALGTTPPPLDFIAFVRENAARPAQPA